MFLWALDDEKAQKLIKQSKSKSLTSKAFFYLSDKVHKMNLISEIEELNREEILTQFSQRDSSLDSLHNIKEFENNEKVKKTLVRDMPPGSVNTGTDPDIDISEENNPTSARNLETVLLLKNQ